MANSFKNAGISVGTTRTTLYQCPNGATSVIHALYITNIGINANAAVDIEVTIDGGTTYKHIGKGTPIPLESTLTLEKPINLESGDIIALKASSVDSIEAFASILEIS